MIRAVIVEDERKSRELLAAFIKEHCKDVNVVALAENVKQGIELINEHKPELVFLDIVMPDGTGFDMLEKITFQGFDIIFTTATDKFAMKAIKYAALDYLLKPIDVAELQQAVEKIVAKKQHSNPVDSLKSLLENLKTKDDNLLKITLPTGQAYEIVLVKDIIRCESDGSYTHFHLTNGRKHMVSMGLKHYEDMLPEKDFMRVHHQHLINLNHVDRFLKVDGGYVVLSDGSQIEVSRRKKDAFLERLVK